MELVEYWIIKRLSYLIGAQWQMHFVDLHSPRRALNIRLRRHDVNKKKETYVGVSDLNPSGGEEKSDPLWRER